MAEKPVAAAVDPNRTDFDTRGVTVKPYSRESTSTTSDAKNMDQTVLTGHADGEVARSIVRIFTSSTFTDTKVERNMLMKTSYPMLKEFCASLPTPLQFEVVDMRWGVRDEMTDDNRTTELCMTELARCQNLSVGVAFITFYAQKYGYRPPPRCIEESEFEQMVATMSDADRTLLHECYKKDDNQEPAQYTLLAVSQLLPDLAGRERGAVWWGKSQQMIRALRAASVAANLSEQRVHHYMQSVTEDEIRHGLVPGPTGTLWFKRTLQGIPNYAPEFNVWTDGSDADKQAASFVDLGTGDDAVAWGLLKKFTADDGFMKANLAPEDVLEYTLQWQGTGVDPSIPEHQAYLDKFRLDFETKLKEKIQAGHDALPKQSRLERELVHHASLSRTKTAMFVGAQAELAAVHTYLASPQRAPLVLWGPSGRGKTSVMAQAYRQCRDVHSTAVVLTRFLGTSGDSSTGRALLQSLCEQLAVACRRDLPIPRAYKELCKRFVRMLKWATPERPFILFLDSIDQLLDIDAARTRLSWLPTKLPDNVWMVLSMLPDDVGAGLVYGCLPVMEARHGARGAENKTFVEVLPLDGDSNRLLLDTWLKKDSRRMTEEQRTVLLDKSQGKVPLFVRLLYELFLPLRSFDAPPSDLPDSAVDVIHRTFAALEVKHGQVLVSHAFMLLTSAKVGLTQAELEDVLSCDDVALAAIFQYWTPPQRRLPPLLWVRIRSDISQYLVSRGVDGALVLGWFHRQHLEAAVARYLGTDKERLWAHESLADYFSNKWIGGRPYCPPDSEAAVNEPRSVAPQGLTLSGSIRTCDAVPNKRRLRELCHHQLRLDDAAPAAETLTSIEYLELQCQLGEVFDVAQEYKTFSAKFSDARVLEFASFFQRHMHYFSKQGGGVIMMARQARPESHVGQAAKALVGALGGSIDGRHLIVNSAYPKLAGKDKCVQSLCADDALRCFTTNKAATVLVAGASDGTVYVWDFETGRQIIDIPSALGACVEVLLTPDEKHVVVRYNRCKGVLFPNHISVRVYDITLGSRVDELPWLPNDVFSLAFSPDGQRVLLVSPLRAAIVEFPSGHELSSHTFGRKHMPSPDRSQFIGTDYIQCEDCVYDLTWTVTDRQHAKGSRLTFSPVAKEALTLHSHKALFWDMTKLSRDKRGDKKWLCLHKTTKEDIHSAIFSPTGTVLFGCENGDIEEYSRPGDNLVRSFKGHTGIVHEMAFTPDGKRLVSCSDDGTVNVWDFEMRDEQGGGDGVHSSEINRVVLTTDGKTVATCHDDGRVIVRCFAVQQPLLEIDGNTNGDATAAFSHDGKLIAAPSCSRGEECVCVYNIATRKIVKSLEDDNVNHLLTSPDGKYLAVASRNCLTIYLWETYEEVSSEKVEGSRDGIRSLAFSRDSSMIAVCSENIVSVFYVKDLKFYRALEHDEQVMEASFNDTGRMLAVAASEMDDEKSDSSGSRRSWDSNGDEKIAVNEDDDEDDDIGEASDGEGKESATADVEVKGYLYVWNLATGVARIAMEAHKEAIQAVRFNKAGDQLYTASADKFCIWQCPRMNLLYEVVGDRKCVRSIDTCLETGRIATGGDDFYCRLWFFCK